MDEITDEQLREFAERGSALTYQWKAVATELLALRGERAKLKADLQEARPYVEWMEGTVTGHASKLKIRALLAKIDDLAQPAESGATERQCDCCGQMKECENVAAFGMDTTACEECRDGKNIEIRRRMDSMGR